ncbi:MAG: hypothetical protein JWP81_1433 [Ferruginibacter sp.]|nr:hypothetical protein [Ferruginibacter sp.]
MKMKMDIKNSADLSAAILELEQRKEREKQQLVQNFHGFKESMTPRNLLKSTFTKVKETPGIKGSILKAALGLGVGLLSKKLIFGKAPGLVRKVVGSAIEMGLAGLVAKKSDTIKSTGSKLLKTLFRPKPTIKVL